MNKKLLEDLAITDGIYDCICDPYDKFNTGDYYGSVMWDLERFAEKIVKECVKVMYDDAIERKVPPDINQTPTHYVVAVLKHFGVEE